MDTKDKQEKISELHLEALGEMIAKGALLWFELHPELKEKAS